MRRWITIRSGLAVGVLQAAVLALLFLAVGAQSAAERPSLIAFTRYDGIYVMRADGVGVRPLRRGGVASSAASLAWSPDGRTLAFAVDSGIDSGIWKLSADGRRLVQLVHAAFQMTFSPAWSPDGRRIAYTRFRYTRFRPEPRGRGELWVMDADGSNQHLLVRMSKPRLYARSEIAWSPSGRRVAFTPCGFGGGLYVMNVNGTGLHRLVLAGYLAREPQWSPDGGSIAFTHDTGSLTGNGENEEIAVLRPDGEAAARFLTLNNVADSDPAWSSDGSRIAFLRGDHDCINCPVARRSSTELYVMNADGSGVKRLTHNRIGEGSPAWQPVASS